MKHTAEQVRLMLKLLTTDHTGEYPGLVLKMLNAYAKLIEQHEDAKSIIAEAIDPGVFGPQFSFQDPLFDNSLKTLCEKKGYGAVLHHVAWLWRQAYPSSAHTVAASVIVRRRFIERAEAFLATEGSCEQISRKTV